MGVLWKYEIVKIRKRNQLHHCDQICILAKMKSSYFITVLFCIKSTLAGIEIPRDGCEWFSGTTYGIDIKCDGKSSFFNTIHPSSKILY